MLLRLLRVQVTLGPSLFNMTVTEGELSVTSLSDSGGVLKSYHAMPASAGSFPYNSLQSFKFKLAFEPDQSMYCNFNLFLPVKIVQC